MFRKSWCPTLTKHQISRLRGGKRNFYYFVGISETAESDVLTNIMHVKLRNQMGSQRSPKFPEGYEPFEATYGEAWLCLRTMTIPVRRLKLSAVGWPNPTLTPRIVTERKPACVLNPTGCTEAFDALRARAEAFEIKDRIRRHATESRAKLDLVLSLMAYRGALPLCNDPADRFEAYLDLRSRVFLQDLLGLLDIPDPLPKPAEPKLPPGGITVLPRMIGRVAGAISIPKWQTDRRNGDPMGLRF